MALKRIVKSCSGILGGGLCLTSAACGAVSPSAPPSGDATDFRHCATLSAPALAELSGLARSTRSDGLWWGIADSGNPAELLAIDTQGRLLGRVALSGARNHDWEDIVSWKDEHGSWLAIADIGDNRAKRSEVQLLIVAEPELGAGTVSSRPLRFVWEGGPRDAEALAVEPERGRFLLISKREKPPALFSLPMPGSPAAAPGALHTARLLARLPPLDTEPTTGYDLISASFRGQPTAADLSPDGHELLVLGYTHLAQFRRRADEDWAQAITRTPRFHPLPPVAMMEAVAWNAAGDGALIGSERQLADGQLYCWTPPSP